MKQQIYWGLGLICLLLVSCTKQDLTNPVGGSTGATGPTGSAGANGNSNVEVYNVTVQPPQWSCQGLGNQSYVTNSNYWSTTLWSGKTNSLDGAVEVYLFTGSAYLGLPWNNPGQTFGFKFIPDTLGSNLVSAIIQPVAASDTVYKPVQNLSFRLVFIPPALKALHRDVNYKDYVEVSKAFHLPKERQKSAFGF